MDQTNDEQIPLHAPPVGARIVITRGPLQGLEATVSSHASGRLILKLDVVEQGVFLSVPMQQGYFSICPSK